MTHKQRVLERLKEGPATHLELYRLGCVAHSRISDLRADGWQINRHTETADGETLHVYTLAGLDEAGRGVPGEQPAASASLPVSSSPAAVSSPPTVTAARAPRKPKRCRDCGADFWNAAAHLEQCRGPRLRDAAVGHPAAASLSLGGARTDGIGPPAAQLTLGEVA